MTSSLPGDFVPDTSISVRRATEFTYLPDGAVPGEEDLHLFSICVAWRGPGSWAVLWTGQCWGTDGWAWEPSSSGRGARYLAEHRFTVAEAEAIALREVNGLTVNGRTWAMLRQMREAGGL